MGEYNSAVITRAGRSLLARSVTEKKAVSFSGVRTSGFAYPPETDLAALTRLEDVKQEGTLSEAQKISDSTVRVSAVFENFKVKQSYFIRNIGVYAKLEEDIDETLFSVCTAQAPDEMPAYNGEAPAAFIYAINSSVSSAPEVEITVNPVGTVTVQEAARLKKELEEKIALSGKESAVYTDTKVAETAAQKASREELAAHTGDGAVHITAAERTKWNAKQDKLAVDDALNASSANPVQNKAVTERFNTLDQSLEDVNGSLTDIRASFQNGCSVIAGKLTACGAATAENASPAAMAEHIQSIYNNRYNQGYNNGVVSGRNEMLNNSRCRWVSLPFSSPVSGALFATGIVYWSGSGNLRGHVGFTQNGSEMWGNDISVDDGNYKWHAYWGAPTYNLNITPGASYDININGDGFQLGDKRAVFIQTG